MKKVVITDSLFILDKHVSQLQAAGFEVVRIDEPKATEETLIAVLQNANGYILGGFGVRY